MQHEVCVELDVTGRHGGQVEALEFRRGGHHRAAFDGGHACGAAGQRLGANLAAHAREVKAVHIVPEGQASALLSSGDGRRGCQMRGLEQITKRRTAGRTREKPAMCMVATSGRMAPPGLRKRSRACRTVSNMDSKSKK